MPSPSTHPPAWYPDPDHPDRIRRWDGRSWTGDVRPLPAWLRTLRLSPGPTARVPRGSRRLWMISAACLLAGGMFLLVLSRGEITDPDRLSDRTFTKAADQRCAAVDASEPAALLDDWAGLVDDLRDLPVATVDEAAVDRWLRAWERSIDLGRDRLTAMDAGDDDAADRAVQRRQGPEATRIRFALVNGMNACLFR
ncbi:MAG TPA: DUF2510 domain-containing protein [Acidimicrobiales bacterium]|nr:DUF2510 domain-containing protein [Acidimicrobiales bacterium]